MTGEMSSDEVTKENYPGLFNIKHRFEEEGFICEPRPFDQMQGPYLQCVFNDINFEIWYDGGAFESFVLVRRIEGKRYFYGFHPSCDVETIKSHLLKTNSCGYISSLEDEYLEVLNEFFKGDTGKFEQWLTQGELRGFDGRPTLKEEISLFHINIRPKACTPEYWETLEHDIAFLLEGKGLSGHVESVPTENSTSF